MPATTSWSTSATSLERLRDGIYVLRIDDALVVKRIALNPVGRRVTVQSDNPAYPDWPDCSLKDINPHRPRDLVRTADRLAAAPAVDQPSRDGKGDAGAGADQDSLHRIADRKAEAESRRGCRG